MTGLAKRCIQLYSTRTISNESEKWKNRTHPNVISTGQADVQLFEVFTKRLVVSNLGENDTDLVSCRIYGVELHPRVENHVFEE